MMTTAFSIISTQQDDLPTLIALWRERMTIISQTVPHLSSLIETDEAHLMLLQACLLQTTTHLLCAKTNKTPIGYILGIQKDDTHIIEEIALDAHTYHRGLGKALVQAVLTQFSDNTSSPIYIRVPRHYAVEQAFWRALGAKQQKEIAWRPHPLYTWMTLSSDPPQKPM